MARNPGADAAEEAQALLDAMAGASPSDFELVAFIRSREARLCHAWLTTSPDDDETSGERAAVFGALVDALEPNGGWWLDVTAETLVEAGIRDDVVSHQLEVLTGVIADHIRAEHGEQTADTSRARLEKAAQDLVAACGRRNQTSS